MAEMQKFMFEEDFEDPSVRYRRRAPVVEEVEEVPPEPEPPPPPTFSEEELAAARDESFAAGHSAASMEAAASVDHQVALALDAIANQMAHMADTHRRTDEDNAAMAAELVMLVTRKLIPTYVGLHGMEEVVGLVAQCLPHVLDQPRLIVRAPRQYTEALGERLEVLAAANGFEGKLILMPGDDFGPADCRVEWTDGGAERDTGRVWRDINAIIARYMGEGRVEDVDEGSVTADAGTEAG